MAFLETSFADYLGVAGALACRHSVSILDRTKAIMDLVFILPAVPIWDAENKRSLMTFTDPKQIMQGVQQITVASCHRYHSCEIRSDDLNSLDDIISR